MPDGPPRAFRDLRTRIMERAASLPKRLAQVAAFAIEHPQDVAFGRVNDLAARAGVQPSALVRFAQALGYAGFSDMQAVFLAHARERWPEYPERLEALGGDGTGTGDPIELLHGFARASSESLGRLAHSVDGESLRHAVTLLTDAHVIALLATRRSFPAAAYLSYAFRRLAIRCELVDQSAGLGAEQLELLQPADSLLAISFTPYAPLTLELATLAAKKGVPVVAITDSAFSPLARIATAWLEVAEADHAAFRSMAGTFAVATTLAVAVASRRNRAGSAA